MRNHIYIFASLLALLFFSAGFSPIPPGQVPEGDPYSGLPAQTTKLLKKALRSKELHNLKWVQKDLRGSKVFLVQATILRQDEDEDGEAGDSWAYFLVENGNNEAKLWKLYDRHYPKDAPMIPTYGFVKDPGLQAMNLDLFVNQDTNNSTTTKDYFRFIPGKGVHLVLSCPDYKLVYTSEEYEGTTKKPFASMVSTISPESNVRLKVVTRTDYGATSIDPDPQKAAAETTKEVVDVTRSFQWNKVKGKYELLGAPVTQKVQ